MDGIDEIIGTVAAVGLDADRNGAAVGGAAEGGRALGYAVFGTVGRVVAERRLVFNPAVVLVVGRTVGGDEREVVAGHFPRVDAAVLVEDDCHLAVADGCVHQAFFYDERVVGRGYLGQLGVALAQGVLLRGYRIAGLGIRRGLFQAYFEVEQRLHISFGLCRVGDGYLSGQSGIGGGQVHLARLYGDTVLEDGVLQNEIVGIREVVGVGELQGLVGSGEAVELDVLVHLLYLCQFGRPCAVCRDETVVAEVALMRAGVVVARSELVLSVLDECAVLDVVGGVDGLVHPVPDTTADAVAAALHDVPVFLQVAYGVAHGVGIFAHEIGLAAPVSVAVAFHIVQSRIHLAPYLRGLSAGAGGTLIVYGARVEFAGGCETGLVVLSVSALVAEAPEDDGRIVAVAYHHADGAVDVLRFPGGDGRDAGVAVVVPAAVTFHIGLVHDVESVVVEDGVHLGLARIVARTYGVHVGLLHHGHIL